MKKLPNWADTKSGNKNVVEIIDILTDEDNAEEWDPEASVPGPSIRNAAKKRTGVYVWREMKVNRQAGLPSAYSFFIGPTVINKKPGGISRSPPELEPEPEKPSRSLRPADSVLPLGGPARPTGGEGVHLYVCDMCAMYVWLIYRRGWDGSVTPGGGPVGVCLEANLHLGVAKGGSCGPGRPSALQ